MTHLSRLVMGAVLAAGMVATTARAAEPDKLLPAATDTVFQVNIRQVLDSDIVKKYALDQVKQLLEGRDLKKMLTELGLDPLKDVEKVVVGTSGDTKADLEGLVIIHGKFDAQKLFKTAESLTKKDGDKFSMIKDGNTIMFKFQPENGDKPFYGTVVDDTTVIAGTSKKLILDALTASGTSKPAPLKANVAALVKKMDEKSSVYAVSVLKGKLEELPIPGGGPVDLEAIKKLLPKTQTATVGIKIGMDVVAEVTLGMEDEEAAGDMRNALDTLIKQLKPLAQLAAAAEPRAKPLGDILGTVKTSAKNKDVVITAKITGANIGKMVNPNDD